MRILTIVVWMGIGTSLSVGQSDTYSSWRQITGQSRIEYRWKTLNSGCDIQLRNLDDKDSKFYSGTIDYVYKKDDRSDPIVIEHFVYAGDVRSHFLTNCDRVSDVLLRVKE